MNFMKRLEQDLENAEIAGDEKKASAVEWLLSEFKRNAQASKHLDDGALLEKLRKYLEVQIEQYDDYVTADHGKAKLNYQNDLRVIEKYLEEF
jgi:uncharacterized protein YqeY